MKITSLLLLGLLPVVNAIETVNVNVQYYTGVWYQTYADKAVLATFERNAYCVYANYSIANSKTINVYNYERVGSPDGPVQDISGYAVVTDEPGQLVVHFPHTKPSPYWVIKIGPIKDLQYQYSIVSDPYMVGLYVLARNIDEYYELYNDEVMEFLNESGYTNFYNKPLKVIHDGCSYD